jgi:cytochrome P450
VQDILLGNVSLPAGAQVRLCLGAANRDVKHYANPELFVLSRYPKDNLAFGAGTHYCLGAMLARILAQCALRTLLTCCPEMRLTQPAGEAGRYVDSDKIRALESLIVKLQ